MRKLLALLLAITLVYTLLVGCGSVDDTTEKYKGMRKASFKNVEFYVYKDWEEGTKAGEDDNCFMYYYPDNGMLMINLQATDTEDIEDGENMPDFMEGIKKGFKNYTQHSLKKITLKGYKGFKASYSGTIKGNDTTNEMVVLAINENQLLVMTMTYYDLKYNFYQNEFKKILSTIKVKENKETTVEEAFDDDYDEIDEETVPDVPEEYLNALEDADSYANDQHMSKKSLYHQLTSEYGEGYSKKAAKYAVKHVDTNYKKNALYTAESYANDQHMSKKELYHQLISESGEQFTEKQAKYAIKHVKANWKKNALITAKSYMEDQDMSKQEVYQQLISSYGEQFTVEEAKYAINHLK